MRDRKNLMRALRRVLISKAKMNDSVDYTRLFTRLQYASRAHYAPVLAAQVEDNYARNEPFLSALVTTRPSKRKDPLGLGYPSWGFEIHPKVWKRLCRDLGKDNPNDTEIRKWIRNEQTRCFKHQWDSGVAASIVIPADTTGLDTTTSGRSPTPD